MMTLMMQEGEQKRSAKLTYCADIANLMVERNKWVLSTVLVFLLSCFLLGYCIILHNRLLHDTRIVFVKLAMDGAHSIESYDANQRPTFYINTVNALLRQFVERYCSKRKTTIVADYGFSYHFLSAPLAAQFLGAHRAAQVANEHAHCEQCNDVEMSVDAIQHFETDEVIIHHTPTQLHRSTIYATTSIISPRGHKLSQHAKIITLLWRVRPITQLPNDIESLTANPIGIEITRISIKDNHSLKEAKLS